MQDKATIHDIASKRAHGSPSALAAWQNALEPFPDLPGPELAIILEAAPSHETIRPLGRFIGREEDPAQGVRDFLKVVDESPEPLSEWMKSIEVFALFIESTPHRPSLRQVTGYLHCCLSLERTGTSYATFTMAVETMLETYGYAGEEA
jgi:hypothetical protein